ncbi:epididymal-specific lipocalin-5-like [Dasypus novemcinctus]|uniref:epididymal-specific lipocalin-5-like n=1 Tax=Dasypus novemcinctus TaxID=9361 RepID=UPI0039C926A3
MDGRLLATLLGLCAVLAAHAQEAARKEFDFLKFSGLWFEIAFASDVKPPSLPARPRRMGAVMVKLDDGNLVLTSVYDGSEDCVKETDHALYEEDVPGRFMVPLPKGSKEVLVQATNYQSYAILNVTVRQDRGIEMALKLYSRKAENNAEAIEKFRKMAAKQGFQDEDVHLLTPDSASSGDTRSHGRGRPSAHTNEARSQAPEHLRGGARRRREQRAFPGSGCCGAPARNKFKAVGQ